MRASECGLGRERECRYGGSAGLPNAYAYATYLIRTARPPWGRCSRAAPERITAGSTCFYTGQWAHRCCKCNCDCNSWRQPRARPTASTSALEAPVGVSEGLYKGAIRSSSWLFTLQLAPPDSPSRSFLSHSLAQPPNHSIDQSFSRSLIRSIASTVTQSPPIRHSPARHTRSPTHSLVHSLINSSTDSPTRPTSLQTASTEPRWPIAHAADTSTRPRCPSAKSAAPAPGASPCAPLALLWVSPLRGCKLSGSD